MRDEFFEKILNVVEGRPFISAVVSNGEGFETIAQITESEYGDLTATFQAQTSLSNELDDAQITMTLPTLSEFGLNSNSNDVAGMVSERRVPLHPSGDFPLSYASTEQVSLINAKSISLSDPVRAKTLTLWFQGIRAEGWDTNSDREAVIISHGDAAVAQIPPHGTTDFFIAIAKPEEDKPSVEWDIGDIHQGVIVRTDHEKPVIRVTIGPSDERDITWNDYIARIEVERGDFEIEDVTLHIWRIDGAEMDLTEITALEKAISYGLSFMNSTMCRAKVSIGWKETWSDSRWRGTWKPVWGAWKATLPILQDRHKNWMPIETKAEKVLEQVLRFTKRDHYPVIERYTHNSMALDKGDWASSITASVAILQRLSTDAGFRIERRGLELWDGIAQYLRSKAIDRPYYYVGWGDEAKDLIEDGEPHENLVKKITELRNNVTGHWSRDSVPEIAIWLAQQALYYVESAMHAELAPTVPMWDRTRGFAHPPKQTILMDNDPCW